MQVGLGATGVLAEVVLQCVPAHQLLEHTFVSTLKVQKYAGKGLGHTRAWKMSEDLLGCLLINMFIAHPFWTSPRSAMPGNRVCPCSSQANQHLKVST